MRPPVEQFNSEWLIGKRQFRSLTGIKAAYFTNMVERVRAHWQRLVMDVKNRSGRPWEIGGLEDHLLELLILYRCAVTQDFLGCLYRVEKSAVCRTLQGIEPIVNHVHSERTVLTAVPLVIPKASYC